jgi:hypothetical protein
MTRRYLRTVSEYALTYRIKVTPRGVSATFFFEKQKMGFVRAILCLALMQIASASVIGIDFGSNYMKVQRVHCSLFGSFLFFLFFFKWAGLLCIKFGVNINASIFSFLLRMTINQ